MFKIHRIATKGPRMSSKTTVRLLAAPLLVATVVLVPAVSAKAYVINKTGTLETMVQCNSDFHTIAISATFKLSPDFFPSGGTWVRVRYAVRYVDAAQRPISQWYVTDWTTPQFAKVYPIVNYLGQAGNYPNDLPGLQATIPGGQVQAWSQVRVYGNNSNKYYYDSNWDNGARYDNVSSQSNYVYYSPNTCVV